MAEAKPKTIRTDQIPEQLKQSIAETLQHYAVSLVGLRGEEDFAHLGSGTLVKIDGRPFVLTAAHCATALREWQHLGLCMVEGIHRMDFPVPPALIVLGEPEWGELGPDLALIPIPYDKVGTIEARKNFHPLDRDRDARSAGIPPVDWGLWYLVGAPIEVCDLSTRSALAFQQIAFLASPEIGPEHGGFDCVDVTFPADAAGVPSGFEGVSGGGLWHVNITDANADGLTVKPPLHLEGVAFYQFSVAGGRRRIRCQGPRSIYGRLLDVAAPRG